MTDETIDDIKERKVEQLRNQQMGAGDEGGGADEAPDEPIYLDDAGHLDEIVDSYDVVLADFFADWCGPCKMVAPIVEDVAAETDAAAAKVDVDEYQRLATQYGVQGVPTLVVFADGQPAERLVGAQGKEQLFGAVRKHL
ncbi:MAG: thioredoxin [Halobacteriales archaeon]